MKKINNKRPIFLLFLSFLIFVISFLIKVNTVQAGTEHNVWGWGWSDTVGWISFNSINCDYDGDGIYEGAEPDGEEGPNSLISGYCSSLAMYDPVLQHLSFCDFNGNGIYEGANEDARPGCPGSGTVNSYGVHICNNFTEPLCLDASENSQVVGYAWSENIGWIRFDPEPDPGLPNGYPASPYNSVDIFEPKVMTSYTWWLEGWARACSVFKDDVAIYGVDCQCGEVCQDLKPSSERGGWDGWLKMALVTVDDGFDFQFDYIVYIEEAPPEPPNEFGWYAWGDGEPGIGWLSFTCYTGGASRNDICPTSSYEVFTSVDPVSVEPEGNQPPVVSNPLIVSGTPTYCNIGPGKGQVSFRWTYQDAEGDDQEYYNLQIDTTSDFSNCPPIGYDCPVDRTYDEEVVVEPIGEPGDSGVGTSGVVIVTGEPEEDALEIAFNTTYFWRVRAGYWWEGTEIWSNWANGPSSFTTKPHAYPWPNFSYTPSEPSILETTTFSDNPLNSNYSKCYNPNGYPCNNSANNSYTWDFDYETGIDIFGNYSGNPGSPLKVDTSFSPAGTYTVRLEVFDELNNSCSKERSVPVGQLIPPPKWKEIAPP